MARQQTLEASVAWSYDMLDDGEKLLARRLSVMRGFTLEAAQDITSDEQLDDYAELLEAARIDGANEIQIFFKVIIPAIKGAIMTVSTTIFIAVLKVFDIVYVMTSGKFETEVVANRMFVEMFNFRNFGRASALAVILLVVVIPIMVANVRNLRKQGINQ